MLKKETELKALLSKQEYQKLMNLLVSNSCRTTEQMNYYFDTPNEELRSKNVTCRIRQKEDKLIGTKKSHFYKPNEAYSIEEDFPVSEFCTCLYIDNKKLELKGELFTKRITIPWGPVGHLALDLNMYLGTVDYELEFEYLPCFKEIAVQTFSSILALFVEYKLKSKNHKIYGFLTHTCPISCLPTEMFISTQRASNPKANTQKKETRTSTNYPLDIDRSTEEWFESLMQKSDFKIWYCGHYHVEKELGKVHLMHKRIIPLFEATQSTF